MTEPPVPTVEPGSEAELAGILAEATRRGQAVQVVGGGTRSGYGSPGRPDLLLSTRGMGDIIAWEPDDLTLVVGAGASIAGVEEELNRRGQTMALPEAPGASTVGGAVAAGVSSLKRLRLYGTRERILEAVAATGDGRVVRSGGRVVKNVTGYDLFRLHVGAFGSLGVLTSICLKLWPVPPASATVTVEGPEAANAVTRPLAVLEERGMTRVYLWGTEDEVAALGARFRGLVAPGLDWPADPVGRFRWSLRVPPGMTPQAVARLPEEWEFLAVHGVGEVRAASPTSEGAAGLRQWAEAGGGRLVVVEAPAGELDGFDPWGSPPPGLDHQRRLIAQFDPARVINPGRLPGGL